MNPRLAVFVSGGGSNLAAIHAAIVAGALEAELACVISNSAGAGGLERAFAAHIPAAVFNPRSYRSEEDYAADLIACLRWHQVDFIALAGYLKKLPDALIEAYPGRIINIHPALLPRHGGKGMYGLRVHASVLAAGDRESGPSVHVVTPEYDEGPILAQERLPVEPGETPESLAARVLAAEHRLYPAVLQRVALALRAGGTALDAVETSSSS